MAYIVEPDVVHYTCSCGLLKPISRLYFCRRCLELRCGFCVCHEVDSLFCGKCLDNRTSKEAAERKNKCLNCFVCPSCQQQLSIRASTVKNPNDPSESTKVVYLLCLWCRWTTRDVGMPDLPVGNNRWPERENVYANRLHDIQERYKSLVLADVQMKLEKEKKRQKKYMTYTDRTGVTAAMIRKRFGIPEVPNPHLKSKIKEADPAVPHEHVDDLPAELLTEPLVLTNITTMEQRLILPDMQPTTVDKLYPVRKQLSVKQSLRCRTCEHNVSKPEYNPNSIKFKIQLFAYNHIPEIRIFTVEPLRASKQCELLLKFINPTQYATTVRLLPLEFACDEGELPVAAQPEVEPEPASLLKNALARQQSVTLKPRAVDLSTSATVVMPQSGFVLAPRDDAAEYDDTGDVHSYQDDPQVVVHRKSNKVTIRLRVTPGDLNLGDDVTVGFTMEHVYTNSMATTIDNKEPVRSPHRVRVFLTLGKLVGSQ